MFGKFFLSIYGELISTKGFFKFCKLKLISNLRSVSQSNLNTYLHKLASQTAPLDFMKLYLNTIITKAYHISRCSSWKLSSKVRIAWAFIILVRILQGEKQKRCHPKSHYRLWQATHFSTKNPINKPAMNKRTLLIAAVFHFVHPVEKDS